MSNLHEVQAAIVLNGLEQQAQRDHIEKLDAMEERIATFLELGGTVQSVWARLQAAKARAE